ncbi:hydroxymethylglutaryl-CoA lyase, partial [Sinorhizobium meliloti]
MTSPAKERVTIVEVAPRDGLQNESRLVATEDKVGLVDLLSDCGYERIEVTSFVSPRWVPQLADAPAVMAGIVRRPGTRYAALTPNMRGFEAALAASADEVAIFASASESFSEKNINCSIAESIERFRPVAEASRHRGVPLRGYVSCV